MYSLIVYLPNLWPHFNLDTPTSPLIASYSLKDFNKGISYIQASRCFNKISLHVSSTSYFIFFLFASTSSSNIKTVCSGFNFYFYFLQISYFSSSMVLSLVSGRISLFLLISSILISILEKIYLLNGLSNVLVLSLKQGSFFLQLCRILFIYLAV